MKSRQENLLIGLAFAISAVLLGFVFYQSQGIEGGLDSWNHYLISRSALNHPELLLDQWNKPVFTWFTVFICQYGMDALIVFNISCVCISGLLVALSMKKQNYKNAWLIIPFVVFTPILFENIISGLTEPLNVLFLALVYYFWSSNSLKLAVAIASFLPFVRTEGFVICGAVLLVILYRRQYKLILWLLIGSLVMNMVGWIISGEPFWIITENPYWKHETEGTFEAGSGSFFHFINQSRALFGLPLLLLFFLAHLFIGLALYKKQSINSLVLLSFLVFYLYFFAHTTIYYFGILGSHGLTRVMAVIAPSLAILALYSIDSILKSRNKNIQLIISMVFAGTVVWTAYHESGYAKPHRIHEITVKPDKTQRNFIKAGEWLEENDLMDRTIIHQSPFFDVEFNRDPFDIKSSYYVWSINKENDWAEKGVIVIWDGFSAVREGNMPLEWLQNNSNYKLLHYIEGFEKPENDPKMYDIYIWEKVGPL